jgi:inorganic pyrophosphatase
MPLASELHCRVQTPKGSPFGARQAVVCPVDCGVLPDTLAGGGGPLEAIVCVSEPGAPGGRVAVKPIALLRTRGRHGDGQVVVCVACRDPSSRGIDSVHELSAETRADIERFITTRPPPEEATEVVAWCSREDALTAIDDAAAKWTATVNGRG